MNLPLVAVVAGLLGVAHEALEHDPEAERQSGVRLAVEQRRVVELVLAPVHADLPQQVLVKGGGGGRPLLAGGGAGARVGRATSD